MPSVIASCPLAESTRTFGRKFGEIRSGPRSRNTSARERARPRRLDVVADRRHRPQPRHDHASHASWFTKPARPGTLDVAIERARPSPRDPTGGTHGPRRRRTTGTRLL